MRVFQCIEQVEKQLMQAELSFGHGTDNPGDEAYYLVLGSLGIGFNVSDESLQRKITDDEVALIQQRLRQRIEERVPVAYLVGEAWFAGHCFRIDKRALIPRSPIAELIVNEFDPLLSATPRMMLDLCCGSGCIGIACALQFTEARVDLADVSTDALALAQENIESHGLENRVRAVKSDVFANLESRYDLILANPPYVGIGEYKNLPAEYHHEPELGLVTEDSGLQIPLRILREASNYLQPEGMLIMEVGYSESVLIDRCPQVPFLWLEFEHGGEGVLALGQSQLLQHRDSFI